MSLAPTCYPKTSHLEKLTERILQQVKSSTAQGRRRTVISRLPNEQTDDWDRLLNELEIEENVRLIYLNDGEILLTWTNQHC